MTKVWKPSPEERIEWDHPFIQLTKTAPGYLVQEMFGYSDAYWEKFLHNNKHLWIARNRRPWIYLELLGRTDPDNFNEA